MEREVIARGLLDKKLPNTAHALPHDRLREILADLAAAVHVVDRERRELQLARGEADEVTGDDHEAVLLGELSDEAPLGACA